MFLVRLGKDLNKDVSLRQGCSRWKRSIPHTNTDPRQLLCRKISRTPDLYMIFWATMLYGRWESAHEALT